MIVTNRAYNSDNEGLLMESNGRIAELMAQLSDGRTMALTDIQTSYDVSRRTAQRDLAFIRHAVIEYNIGNLVENNGAYQLVAKDSIDNYAIVLAISNILLGSRALTTEELTLSINFLMQRLSPTVKQELSEQLIFPKNSYLPLSQARPLLKLLRDMAKCIQHHQKICFTYISNSVTPPESQAFINLSRSTDYDFL